MEVVQRKKIRLAASEYESGWYFVTVCTENREKLLAKIKPFVGADDSVRPCGASGESQLSDIGMMVRDCLERLSDENAGITLDKYVVMPNHVHMIVHLSGETGGQSRPPLQRVVQRFKSITTRKCWALGRQKLWQRSYYDHIIRNAADYLRIWQYIDENPVRWAEDVYYAP